MPGSIASISGVITNATENPYLSDMLLSWLF
jgi:hypothetical protein